MKYLPAAIAVVRDLAGIVGAGLIAFGAYQVYPPAGFVVGGGLMLAGALLTARQGAR